MRRTRNLTELAGRSYWREGEARQIVETWRQSGERVSLFAARLRVDPRRVSRWASRLDRSEAAVLRFHPVRVAHRLWRVTRHRRSKGSPGPNNLCVKRGIVPCTPRHWAAGVLPFPP